MASPGPSSPSVRPVPNFYVVKEDFRTKKEANRRRRSYVPRPPAKHLNRLNQSHAKRVSFREHTSADLSMNHLYDMSKSESYFRQVFEVEDKIGEGSFAEVFRARDKERGQYFAIKQTRGHFKNQRDRKRQLEEVRKHEAIPPHPNCLRYVDAWEEDERLYLQTELCRTSLSNYCEEHHDIPEKLVWNYLVDLLRALKHLHDHDLVHLDVKPENILISSHGVLKLGDFGLVHDLKRSTNDLDPQDGDGKYLAPEVMSGEIFSKAADMFSLGVTILEMAVDLDVPSSGPLWSKLREGELPDDLFAQRGLSQDLVDIIRKLLNPVPDQRPTVDLLLMHPAVKKVAWKRELLVNLHEKLDSAYSALKGATNSVLSSIMFLLHALWSWFPRPWWQNSSSSSEPGPSGSGEESLVAADWTVEHEVSAVPSAVQETNGDKNGTPPNIRASCALPSPVMKSHTDRAPNPLYSPRSGLAGPSAFTSTPMKDAVPGFSTPQITPVHHQSRTPLTMGSGSVRRRLNLDKPSMGPPMTPEQSRFGNESIISSTVSKITTHAAEKRNLFSRAADISADEEEDNSSVQPRASTPKKSTSKPGVKPAEKKDHQNGSGSPGLRRRTRQDSPLKEDAQPKKKPTFGTRLEALKKEEGVGRSLRSNAGGSDAERMINRNLSKDFDSISDSEI